MKTDIIVVSKTPLGRPNGSKETTENIYIYVHIYLVGEVAICVIEL